MAQRSPKTVDEEWVDVPTDGDWVDVPAQTAPAQRAPVAEGSFLDNPIMPKLKSAAASGASALSGILPSGQTAAQLGGMMIGGVAGAPAGPAGVIGGAGVGSAAGQAGYNLMQQLRGAPDAPQTAGEAAQSAGMAGLSGAAGEAAGPIVAKGLSKLFGASSRQAVGHILGPRGVGQKAEVLNMADELAKDMPASTSTTKLLGKVKDKLNNAGTELEQAWNAIPPNRQFSTTPIVQGLQKERAALDTRGVLIPGTEGKAKVLDNLIDFFGQNPDMTMRELRSNRQAWDEIVNWWRAPLSKAPPSEQAYETSANLTRDLINTTFPEIAAKNHAVKLWKTAHDIFSSSEVNRFGTERIASMGNAFWSGGGAAIGRALGGPMGALEGGLAAPLIRQTLLTPAYQSMSLAGKQAVMTALKSGNVQKAVGLLSAGVTNKALQPVDLK